ncbi:MAG: hypothetical protein QOF96_3556 [Actinomycetota bacterium]|nr:hypothetical protein [Actinomycetota bacterium]
MAQSLTAARSATLTVLVVAGSEAEAASARETIGALQGRSPVRALVVVDRDGGWPAPALRSVVEASVRGDVPLVLWRPAGLPDASDPVLGWIEHLVVDSRTVLSGSRRPDRGDTPRPPGLGVAGVVDLAGRMPVTDLAWVALAQWRELVAGLFDGPDRGPFLADVRHVRVQGHEALRPLLAGWLLSRLRIPPGVVEVGPSEGLSVEVTAEHNGRQGHFSVAWSAESHLIDARVVIGTGPPQVRRWRRDEAGPVGLLGRALARLGWDPVYGEALTAAVVLRAESARRSGPGPT